ncbi:MAG: nucleoside 2-deoxyribosyltransferase domain-containing protein [Pseudomonadota bacterium]|nr:nucleoside 2-deoxyribosyltransferase domain-containing protein [Pseudomonadota bacterium]
MSKVSQLVRPGERIPIAESVFLAGPTPRDMSTLSWRPAFIEGLLRRRPTLTIFSPEGEKWRDNYDDQVRWEWEALSAASLVLFWIPRDLLRMPALTTNVEFGMVLERGWPCIAGWPVDAPKNKYLAWHAKRRNIPVHPDPETLMDATAAWFGDLSGWRPGSP